MALCSDLLMAYERTMVRMPRSHKDAFSSQVRYYLLPPSKKPPLDGGGGNVVGGSLVMPCAIFCYWQFLGSCFERCGGGHLQGRRQEAAPPPPLYAIICLRNIMPRGGRGSDLDCGSGGPWVWQPPEPWRSTLPLGGRRGAGGRLFASLCLLWLAAGDARSRGRTKEKEREGEGE